MRLRRCGGTLFFLIAPASMRQALSPTCALIADDARTFSLN
jgi:hypothetical protein